MKGRGRVGAYENALEGTGAVLMGGAIFFRHEGDDSDRQADELLLTH
jgi:hypothetical protein